MDRTLVDNDDAMIGIIWSRRKTLKAGFGALLSGGIAASLFSCASKSSSTAATTTQTDAIDLPAHEPLVASPALTEGPFFVDEKLNRSNLLAGTTRQTVVEGSPLLLNLKLLCLDARGNPVPLSGAQVDVWHSDAVGIYSDENYPMNPEVTSGQQWLRGYQLVDSAGMARFSTIVPGWYDGRTPHIHFKVRQFSSSKQQTAEFTSQLFFQDQTLNQVYTKSPYDSRGSRRMSNTDDGIYTERLKDGSYSGDHQLLRLVPAADGYTTQFTIVLTDASLHDGREQRNEGPDRGAGGGPGGPPNAELGRPLPWIF